MFSPKVSEFQTQICPIGRMHLCSFNWCWKYDLPSSDWHGNQPFNNHSQADALVSFMLLCHDCLLTDNALFCRKFHTHILQFDGTGSWTFSELNAKSRIQLKIEKEVLLKAPDSPDKLQRLSELNRLLGEDENE